MGFQSFNNFEFMFQQLAIPLRVSVPISNDDAPDDGFKHHQNYETMDNVMEPIVNSTQSSITNQNNAGGMIDTDSNGWESHMGDIPRGTIVESKNDGRKWEVVNSGYAITGGLFYYQLKRDGNN